MKLKSRGNGSQAQLRVMRFIELVEESHHLSLVKAKKKRKIQLILEIKHDIESVWAELESFGLWLYVLFLGRHDILAETKLSGKFMDLLSAAILND